MLDVRSLQTIDCGSCGVKVKASIILHGSIGCGKFSGEKLGAGEILGSFYGTVVYSNLTAQKQA